MVTPGHLNKNVLESTLCAQVRDIPIWSFGLDQHAEFAYFVRSVMDRSALKIPDLILKYINKLYIYTLQCINKRRITALSKSTLLRPERTRRIETEGFRPATRLQICKQTTMPAVRRFYELEDECRPTAKCEVCKLMVSCGSLGKNWDWQLLIKKLGLHQDQKNMISTSLAQALWPLVVRWSDGMWLGAAR